MLPTGVYGKWYEYNHVIFLFLSRECQLIIHFQIIFGDFTSIWCQSFLPKILLIWSGMNLSPTRRGWFHMRVDIYGINYVSLCTNTMMIIRIQYTTIGFLKDQTREKPVSVQYSVLYWQWFTFHPNQWWDDSGIIDSNSDFDSIDCSSISFSYITFVRFILQQINVVFISFSPGHNPASQKKKTLDSDSSSWFWNRNGSITDPHQF